MRFALCTPSPLGFREYSHLQGGTQTPSVSVRTPLVCGLGLWGDLSRGVLIPWCGSSWRHAGFSAALYWCTQCYIRPQYWTFAIWNTFKGSTPARSLSLELKIAQRGITVPMTGVWESLGDENYDFHIALSGGMISFLQQRIVNVVVMAWSHLMQKEEPPRAHGAFDLQHFGAAALGCRRMECQSGGRETGRVGAFLTHSTSNGQDQNLHSYVILEMLQKHSSWGMHDFFAPNHRTVDNIKE